MNRYVDEHENLRGLRIAKDVGMGVALLVALLICWPFYAVPTGFRGVVTTFGAITGVKGEGLAVLLPWEKLNIFSIRAEQADIDKAEGATADTQPVHVSLTVRYSIATDKVSEVFEKYSHDGNLASYVQTASHEIFKAVTARYKAVELIEQRQKVSVDIGTALREKLAIYGAQVISIDMRNFAFSPSYMTAINDKVTQEQLKLTADNKLKTVESEQRQQVVIAEATAKSVKAKADGDAYQVRVAAEAEALAMRVKGEAQATAMRAQANALTANPQLVEMKKAERWDGTLPVWIVPGGNSFMSISAPAGKAPKRALTPEGDAEEK